MGCSQATLPTLVAFEGVWLPTTALPIASFSQDYSLRSSLVRLTVGIEHGEPPNAVTVGIQAVRVGGRRPSSHCKFSRDEGAQRKNRNEHSK